MLHEWQSLYSHESSFPSDVYLSVDTSFEGAVFTQLEFPNACSKLYSAACTGEFVAFLFVLQMRQQLVKSNGIFVQPMFYLFPSIEWDPSTFSAVRLLADEI